ncbi:MAG: isopentenyl-diphosphate delta-isomerase [Gammaproteobacteria bacterium RIFCSPHIGHO2_12_FULL_41_20]|nr:MAG: isopentenyl-diphosphate delta-isomerase [Gammaproteobacteria bacterium RIFCSPHIGHO2_12_FULL_41_20]
MTATEYVILVDEHDQPMGIAEKMDAHRRNLLHRAFSIFIFRESPQQELLIQQRANNKYHAAGLWTNTCCSHPRPNESILQAGQRRLQEELRLTNIPLRSLGWFHYNAHFANGLSENEIDYVLVGNMDANATVTPNPQEAQAYRWITVAALKEEITAHPEQFTPWLGKALQIVCP